MHIWLCTPMPRQCDGLGNSSMLLSNPVETLNLKILDTYLQCDIVPERTYTAKQKTKWEGLAHMPCYRYCIELC